MCTKVHEIVALMERRSVEFQDLNPKHVARTFLVAQNGTANLRTKIVDFREFDSSIILIVRGIIIMSIGLCPEF